MHTAGGPSDFQESYLRFLFGFLGIKDIEVVRAQGVNLSTQAREQALESALATLPQPQPQAQAA